MPERKDPLLGVGVGGARSQIPPEQGHEVAEAQSNTAEAEAIGSSISGVTHDQEVSSPALRASLAPCKAYLHSWPRDVASLTSSRARQRAGTTWRFT